MNRNASESGLALNGEEQHGAVSVSETSWGYIVGQGARAGLPVMARSRLLPPV